MTWEMIRVTGLVALVLLTIAVSLGIAGPAIRRPGLRLTSVTMHLTAAVGGTALVLAHIGLAIVDSWVDVPLSAAIVPGTSTWEPLWIAVGTVAFDLLLVIAVTSALRQHAPGLWWRAHALAYPVYALVWLHTLTIGSDRSTPLMIGIAAVSGAAVASAVVVRLMLGSQRPTGTTTRTDLQEISA
jgi:DMSO/TMAO reductase YedYZ heme-binding membrane subunit